MKAGDLKHRITIERPKETTDDRLELAALDQ